MSARRAVGARIAGVMFTISLVVASLAAQPQTAETLGSKSEPPPDPQISAMLKEVSADRVQRNIETLVGFQNRNTLSSNQPAAQGKGIATAAAWIRSEFERYSAACGNCLQVKTDEFVQQPGPRIPKPTKITNVYAVLPGTNPANAGRIYLVSGHYDSRDSDTLDIDGAAPGANDDASGTAVSLECARVLSQHRFPATLIFLTVAGEEQGLDGSAHFAGMAKSEGWNLDGVLNNDIVGGDRTPGDTLQNSHLVRVFSEGVPTAMSEAQMKQLRSIGGESDSPSRQLARYVAAVARQYASSLNGLDAALVFRRDRYLRGGDHISFNEQGYPAVRFTEFRENFNHQHQNVRTESGIEYGDLPKFVDYGYTANVSRLNAATLASLASAPAPPANVRLLTKALQNDTSLEWQAAPGGLASSYEVVWRDTTAPEWQQVRAVGNTARATLPLSKDNVIFGVRSVDAKGHRSVTVVPMPER